MTVEGLRYVVDNSVAAKWSLKLSDEPHLPEALQLLDDHRTGRVSLIAPSLLAYEQGSSLRAAARHRRIPQDQATELLNRFFQLGIPLIYEEELLQRALELSVQFGAGYADSVYLALSEASQCSLIHADQRLRNAIAGRFLDELWIGDYRSPI